MGTYDIRVNISNKPGISDPEGDTILNDLLVRRGASDVTRVRCSKSLVFTITADDAPHAAEKVRHICDTLRIYNPLVSVAEVSQA